MTLYMLTPALLKNRFSTLLPIGLASVRHTTPAVVRVIPLSLGGVLWGDRYYPNQIGFEVIMEIPLAGLLEAK